MQTILDSIVNGWQALVSVAMTIEFTDVLDVLIVSYLVYKAIAFIRETRAAQLLKGIGLLIIFYFLAAQFELQTLKVIFENIFTVGLIAIIVIFQPELRRVLEQAGRTKLSSFFAVEDAAEKENSWNKAIVAISDACRELSASKTGALMVLERNTKLGEIAERGTVMDAQPSPELICNIFYPKSPLHDGALLVRSGVLISAGCFLPSSEKVANKQLGSRHRAAVGMSENSDSVTVVVSEETGTISIAMNGKLERDFTPETLRERLTAELVPAEVTPREKRAAFWRRSK
ncbi:MAG: diadenylate cyclase CdaA [Oscillospiraceae bacterium]|nr:diadenylate cyclase CdaA [Oscillospiraceae bacterium]